MGFNLNSLGGLISKMPGGSEAVNVINSIGNPIMSGVVSPIANMGTSMLHSVISMSTNMTKAMSNVMEGIGNFAKSPSFVYVLIGGVVIVGVVMMNNSDKIPQMKFMNR